MAANTLDVRSIRPRGSQSVLHKETLHRNEFCQLGFGRSTLETEDSGKGRQRGVHYSQSVGSKWGHVGKKKVKRSKCFDGVTMISQHLCVKGSRARRHFKMYSLELSSRMRATIPWATSRACRTGWEAAIVVSPLSC